MAQDRDPIRPAVEADRLEIEAIVQAAYEIYIPRMGKPPGPMCDDYAARIAAGEAFVLEHEDVDGIAGILVLIDQANALLLDNVAVAPHAQGRGVGRRLVDHAEAEARRRGYAEIALYTHETMTENVAYYLKLGYRETGRGQQAGYDRVFMRKRLGERSTNK